MFRVFRISAPLRLCERIFCFSQSRRDAENKAFALLGEAVFVRTNLKGAGDGIRKEISGLLPNTSGIIFLRTEIRSSDHAGPSLPDASASWSG